MKIALVSLNQAWEDKVENHIRAKNSLKMISKSEIKVDLVVFPEMTLTGFTMSASDFAEDLSISETISFFADCAKEMETNIAFGIILKTDKNPTNNLIILDREGNLLSRYEKIHPFSYAGEDKCFDKGSKVINVELNDIKIGLTICYDLRFPELYQALSKECSVILNIANWPERRFLHWDTLLRARAIENQVYMIGVNRTGVDGKNISYKKSSLIYEPTGDKLEPIAVNSYIDIYELSADVVERCRKEFPVKNDRQVDFYKNIL